MQQSWLLATKPFAVAAVLVVAVTDIVLVAGHTSPVPALDRAGVSPYLGWVRWRGVSNYSPSRASASGSPAPLVAVGSVAVVVVAVAVVVVAAAAAAAAAAVPAAVVLLIYSHGHLDSPPNLNPLS